MATALSPYGRLDRDSPPEFQVPTAMWSDQPRLPAQLQAVLNRTPELTQNVPRTPNKLVDVLDVVDQETVVEQYGVPTGPQPGGV